MFKQLIKNIRQKPKETRNHIALMLSGVVTFLIFSVWAYHIPDTFGEFENRQEAGTQFGFGEFLDRAKEQISTASEAVEQVASSTVESGLSTGTTSADDVFARYWQEYRDQQGVDDVATTSSDTDITSLSDTATKSPAVTLPALESAPTLPPDSDAPRAIRIVTTSASGTDSTSVE